MTTPQATLLEQLAETMIGLARFNFMASGLAAACGSPLAKPFRDDGDDALSSAAALRACTAQERRG